MRGLVQIFRVVRLAVGVSLLSVCASLPAFAVEGPVTSAAFKLTALQLDEAALYCDMPAVDRPEPVVESRISPIWHVDSAHLDPGYISLGYIEDGFAPVDYQALLAPAGGLPEADVEREFGLRLQNGWLLGFTYGTIDTSLRIGAEVVAESVGPVYEGPMFVATWKFR